jgi:hypothetical protein
MMMTLSTSKGLVPSFYGDKPMAGSLLETKFVALLDDYFRFFSQQGHRIGMVNSIRAGLESIMNLLDREPSQIPNTKERNYMVKFSSSFLATDNYQYTHELRELFTKNQALLRRYSFLILDDKTVNASTDVEEEDMGSIKDMMVSRFKESLKTDNPFESLKQVFKFMRESVHRVVYDHQKIKQISREVLSQFTFPAHTYFKSKETALIKGIVVVNSLFRAGSIKELDFSAKDEDYILFKKLYLRVIKDYHFMLVSDVLIGGEKSNYSNGRLTEEEVV